MARCSTARSLRPPSSPTRSAKGSRANRSRSVRPTGWGAIVGGGRTGVVVVLPPVAAPAHVAGRSHPVPRGAVRILRASSNAPCPPAYRTRVWDRPSPTCARPRRASRRSCTAPRSSRVHRSTSGSARPLFLKCEHLQRVARSSTAARRTRCSHSTARLLERGVAAHSSGNHAAALALAAATRGIPAYIVMPDTAPAVKKDAVARLRRDDHVLREHAGGARREHWRTSLPAPARPRSIRSTTIG